MLVGDSEDEKTNSWEWQEIQDLKSEGYSPPSYRFKWDLAADTNFVAGVIYMAEMNPKEPACFEMLGIAADQKRDFNLAEAAFQKAIALGSPKSEILRQKVERLRQYISESLKEKFYMWGFLSLIPLLIVYYIYAKIRDRRRKIK
jgi:hypothetical protein